MWIRLLRPDQFAYEVGAPTSSLASSTDSSFFKIVFSMNRRGCRRARGFFIKSSKMKYLMHRWDEDFADLANLGFAKIFEGVG